VPSGLKDLKGKNKDRESLPRWCYPLFGFEALCAVLLLVASLSAPFADLYNRTVGAALRAALAYLTSWIPFSLAEILLYCLPALLILLTVRAYRYHCDTWRQVFCYLGCIFAVSGLLFSSFALTLGVGHRTTALDKKLGLPSAEVNAQSLEGTARALLADLDAVLPDISYDAAGFSEMPLDLDAMNEALLHAYEPICEGYDFLQSLNSRVKPVIASKAMSYTHITGVYSFYTGEANINVYFPDYTIPYTAAHELAHQRGIARENEANFIAFLVCVGSDDSYVRYSGYMNMLEYILNALYHADREAYRALRAEMDGRLIGELKAYSAFFDQFRDSPAANVSDAVNDTYLKLNGNEAGTASYGLVVELAVAYYAP
jgi:hypothetical protein